MIEQEIKIKLLELAVNRKNLTVISTFQCLRLFERYLNGENLKVLEIDVNSWIEENEKINKEEKEEKKEELDKKIKQKLEQEQLSNKNEKDKSLFEKVFGI